jgi:cyclopropane fatty-acyl-phospholipid synthase-like methyltransferase
VIEVLPIRLLLLVKMTILLWMAWTQARGAPWLPTPQGKVRRMLAMAGVQPGDVVYDLGCGDGRVLVAAARDFGAHAVGVELDPLRYLWSRLRITFQGLRGQAQVFRGDLFQVDLSQADVVSCYLLQSTNDRLVEKLMRELPPGARVVSNSFTFPGLRLVGKDGHAEIYVYRV